MTTSGQTHKTSADAGQSLLSDIKADCAAKVLKIDAGHGLKNRLAAMGLIANTTVRVIRNDGRGQIIASVKNSKIILGRGIAHKILVCPDCKHTAQNNR